MRIQEYQRIERAIDYIVGNRINQPDLAAMAKAAGMSPSHFSRVFKRWSGLSPKQFLQVTTLLDAKRHLSNSDSVLGSAHAVGLSGPSRLHDLFVTIEGLTPGEFTGEPMPGRIRFGRASSPFGPCVIGSTKRGVCYLSFENKPLAATKTGVEKIWPGVELQHDPEFIGKLGRRIFATHDHQRPGLHLRGTNFQVQVWQALLAVPEGQTVSYGELGSRVGMSHAARAVGQAVGRNPIGWLIPCHRVLRASGALGGYRWGAARKQAMLAWEEARAHGPAPTLKSGAAGSG